MPAKRAKHFEEYPPQPTRAQGQSFVWSPPTDLFETELAYVVRIEIAGLREGDFTVNLDRGALVVTGLRQDSSGRGSYHQLEVRYGRFYTQVVLDGEINGSQTSAEYEDGFLTITIPKNFDS